MVLEAYNLSGRVRELEMNNKGAGDSWGVDRLEDRLKFLEKSINEMNLD